MAEKPKAVGSIWNPNSWHWEQKNYTEPAKRLLQQKILSLVLEQDGIKITNHKIKSLTGDAEINVRKGKQSLIYDFQAEVEWQGTCTDDIVEGTYKVSEINQDDPDEIELDHVKTEEKSAFGDRAIQLIKKKFKAVYVETLKTFAEDLARLESDPEKLKRDQEERERALQATQQARAENGDLKQQIFQEQKERDQRLKEEFYQKQVEQKAKQ